MYSNEISTLLTITDTLLPTQGELALTQSLIKGTRTIRTWPNESRYIDFEGGNQGVYKPGIGEECLTEAREACHRLFRRERAVFLVDKMFNFNVIPATIIREVDGRPGSIQQVITNYSLAEKRYSPGLYNDQLSLLALIDLITWNRDRKPDHKLVSQEKVWGIDNGVSLDAWRGSIFANFLLNDLLKYVDNQPLHDQAVANIHDFNDSKEHQTGIMHLLGDLIPAQTIIALLARTKQVGDSLIKNRGRIQVNDLLGKRGELDYNPR